MREINIIQSEPKLIARAQAGDQDAFGQLVQAYEKMVYNTIKMKVVNAEDALDLSQEVFVKIWKSIGSYRGDCRFSTWVYRIATNACFDHLRRNVLPTDSMTGAPDEDGDERPLDVADESLSASPERTLEQRETVTAVRAAIAQLSEEQQEVVLLRDIEGYTYEEIAEMLHLEIGTVKSRLNRARAHLRELLSDLAEKNNLIKS
ncbi:MAG: sigma-70 family RNA polymerase sigma factor [Clostridia bacterium]|nr:sigma-70 family RNA polymerase sigma factor [Clostridia bacterium]